MRNQRPKAEDLYRAEEKIRQLNKEISTLKSDDGGGIYISTINNAITALGEDIKLIKSELTSVHEDSLRCDERLCELEDIPDVAMIEDIEEIKKCTLNMLGRIGLIEELTPILRDLLSSILLDEDSDKSDEVDEIRHFFSKTDERLRALESDRATADRSSLRKQEISNSVGLHNVYAEVMALKEQQEKFTSFMNGLNKMFCSIGIWHSPSTGSVDSEKQDTCSSDDKINSAKDMFEIAIEQVDDLRANLEDSLNELNATE